MLIRLMMSALFCSILAFPLNSQAQSYSEIDRIIDELLDEGVSSQATFKFCRCNCDVKSERIQYSNPKYTESQDACESLAKDCKRADGVTIGTTVNCFRTNKDLNDEGQVL